MNLRTSSLVAVLTASALTACSQTPLIAPDSQVRLAQANWQSLVNTSQPQQKSLLLADIVDEPLLQQIQRALQHNPAINKQALTVESAKQDLVVANAAIWPSLDATFSEQRGKTNQQKSSSLGITANYEIDIWQRLSDAERQANLSLLAKQNNLQQAIDSLASQVINAWFKVSEADALLALYKKRVANAEQNLQTIEFGYQRGINSALDVYLARNELHSERSRLASQQQTKQSNVRQLQLLQGLYPSGEWNAPIAPLPKVSGLPTLPLPSDMVKSNPNLKASWHNLLAADANLAVTHKNRFPSLSLRANLDHSFISANTGWSFLARITQPLFDAGRLKSQAVKARLAVQQAEQQYLSDLLATFNQIENSLTQAETLQTRLKNTLAARDNAERAATLSFEQYQKGLVSFTTVLDSQRREFDAQSSAIQLQYQLIENMNQVFLSLGGDYRQALNITVKPQMINPDTLSATGTES
ncbi:RND transporter [Saccharobesus litoralis]|uniref:RND transporter n=1 Tax=Saccharobesus litoralis TaxID=2172099 RepID=A0A2S0VSU1_9ALTE|nr:TolC family protein [Saccharobesus litoralis]AWB67281.1 RND transporter [Saccharobesus litoralis]